LTSRCSVPRRAAPHAALFVALFALLVAARAAADDAPIAWRQDAALNDVCFIDAEHGWAVGNCGIVWQTTDGGRVWHPGRTNVACRFETVSFVDADHGWIAGGDCVPYLHSSRGTLLTTADGGKTWTNELKCNLPRILHMKMHGAAGWAIGENSAMYPGGIFTTTDAGVTWTSQAPSGKFASWVAAGSIGKDQLAVAGAGGEMALASQGRLASVRGNVAPAGAVRALAFLNATDGFLAGDGGLLMATDDGGHTWHDAATALPQAARHDDFAAIATFGRSIWLAGSPGTLIWHSADAGRTWRAARTGQTVPIHAMTFVDAQRGWAVGALGRILATRDGGLTWRVQIGAAERVAMLGVFARAGDVPLLLFAQTCGNDGYRAAALVMHESQPMTRQTPSLAERRLRDAVAQVGGCAATIATAFPMPDDGDEWSAAALAEIWQSAAPQRSGDERVSAYEAYLVRQIRTWRPEVVVTHDPATAADDRLPAFVAAQVLAAVEKAGDPRAYPALAAEAGLAPWQVSRVYGAMPRGESGPLELTPAKIAPRLGRSLGEAAQPAVAAIAENYAAPQAIAFRPLVDRSEHAVARRDLFAGISREAEQVLRRDLDTASPASLASVQQRLIARRNAQALLDRAGRTQQNTLGWLGQLDALTRGIDDDGAAEIVCQLAETYERSGQWELAAEAYRALSQRYAKTALGPVALAWLIRYETSGEIAKRTRRGAGFAVRQASAEEPADAGVPSTRKGANQASADSASDRRVALLAAALEHGDPHIAGEPALRFPLTLASARGENQSRTRGIGFESLAANGSAAAWQAAAQSEIVLAAQRCKSPRPKWKCSATTEKPYLDGKLDDRLWTTCTNVPLGERGIGGEVRIARDREYLFVAARCPGKRPSAASPLDREAAKRRDGDVGALDRVEVAIDVDRDYSTWFGLTIAGDGQICDACAGDATWNPKWFAVTRQSEEGWYAEAAIPLAELTDLLPTKETPWAVSLRRVQPGVGILSATQTSEVELSPASFGWLEFE
jgi:photosystem II stability/assembly factor-like uncharacterized protein